MMADLNNKSYHDSSVSLSDAFTNLAGNHIVKRSQMQLIRKLGEGAMAEVYEAEYHGKRCAAKKLKPGSTDRRKLDDLVAELNSLASIGYHPNIVAFYGACIEDETSPVLLVELLSGMDLGEFLKTKRPNFDLGRPRFYSWLLDILRALSHLHDRDPILMHRDLKPENLLLTRDRRILKLADFGMSKSVRRERRGSVLHKGSTGTLRWMAPEVVGNEYKDYTEKADIYSAGLIAYYMLTGRRPTIDIRIDPHVRPDLGPAKARWPAVADIIALMWHGNPEERPSATTCMEMMKGTPDHPSKLLTERPPGCCAPS